VTQRELALHKALTIIRSPNPFGINLEARAEAARRARELNLTAAELMDLVFKIQPA
jgi:hypothetical protein